MCWVIIVKNIESGHLEIITPDSQFDADDPRYDKVVHIVPFKEEPDPQRMNFGVHELVKNCVCHPKVTELYAGQKVVSHSAMVN